MVVLLTSGSARWSCLPVRYLFYTSGVKKITTANVSPTKPTVAPTFSIYRLKIIRVTGYADIITLLALQCKTAKYTSAVATITNTEQW